MIWIDGNDMQGHEKRTRAFGFLINPNLADILGKNRKYHHLSEHCRDALVFILKRFLVRSGTLTAGSTYLPVYLVFSASAFGPPLLAFGGTNFLSDSESESEISIITFSLGHAVM